MIETFTSTTFSVGDIFKVYYGEDQFVEIKLVKVFSEKYKLSKAVRDPFSLIFKGSMDFIINQGTFMVEQERVGKFEIFIVPIVPPDGYPEAHYYQSVFS